MYYKLQTFDLGFLKILNCGGVDVKANCRQCSESKDICRSSRQLSWYYLATFMCYFGEDLQLVQAI